ncbi:DEAD/DEAH box helicase [Sneathiella sp.]|uniref:DEAD/DEAH box helicase n=1 Tax=Sneathiella sp. TaxID=1964365 RepID=UPI0039E280DC
MSALHSILKRFRDGSKTEREKGTYFEELVRAYFQYDPMQAGQYDAVWSFADWAKEFGYPGADTGVDLVARIREDQTFCAIQCKFYAEDHRIQKGDLDTFFAASGKSYFTRRIVVDSTRSEWGKNALETLNDQAVETLRISLDDLEKSPIDWTIFDQKRQVQLSAKKELRDHQKKALEKVKEGLAVADRGKLIMACGTGKTFTSLKIAEELAGKGHRVLYLVPSLALMAQTIREWSMDATAPLLAFSACSDVQVGKRKASKDVTAVNIHDLAYPATTNSETLAEKVEAQHSTDRMTVVFSTYQSIQVLSEAQASFGMGEFDLIVCDEAHRTTGATLADEDDSNFVKVHKQEHIKAKKRLYMTATPRIYSDAVNSAAKDANAELASMDNEELFGETLHTISFSEAVELDLLTDYKVIVLAVDEGTVSAGVQRRLSDENSELKLDDATKIIGCYKALTKGDMQDEAGVSKDPMRRAVAFCKDIATSKLVRDEFGAVVEEFLAEQEEPNLLKCELDHVDGTYNAKERNVLLDWLNSNDDPQTCRILSNARCLSEGVDVPSLDAILFMHPRKSQIDVVQSVGRVMRRAPGKQMGYVILPVGIPAGVTPEEALNNNEKYKVVWQILNALRAHDDRFDAMINKIGLGVDVSSQIEVIAIANTLPNRTLKADEGANIGNGSDAGEREQAGLPKEETSDRQWKLFEDEFSKAIMAKIVKRCGTRDYWADWASDIARIAQTHISRITGVIAKEESSEKKAFDAFLDELRDDLNDSITQDEAIEMLAQHVITKPVFDALFEGYDFTKHNPVSIALQKVLDVLDEHNLEKESESLQKFYASVKMRAEGIDSADAKQKIVVELYDKFFRNAFPRMTDRLGIVYTPVEVVDFIIHSVNELLQKEFGQTLGSKGVHIIDPFTGTGTFITRLLQSGLIKPEELAHKYAHEIHANEIVLLAYYIAAINIEAVYHSIAGEDYTPFEGICLTDTFQLYEKDDLVSNLLADNSARRNKQKDLDIRVIIGNPPYSSGQTNANDNNANVAYNGLDESIRTTYAAHTKATNKNALYDSYIRAIRWASDRLAKSGSGVVGFVTGSAWIERAFADGMRKCLAEEFSSLYVFHLRGDIRKNMLSKGQAKEGGNIFGSGSMTGVAISFLVKNPDQSEQGKIYFHDIGDDLGGNDKLAIIRNFKDVSGIEEAGGWEEIVPDQHHDWLNQRDESFDQFIKIGDKKVKGGLNLFKTFSRGIETGRDTWCYNGSRRKLSNNILETILFYNSEVDRYQQSGETQKVKDFVSNDPTKISWSSSLLPKVEKGIKADFKDTRLVRSVYRPFAKTNLYYDRTFNHRVGQMPHIFPTGNEENRVIALSGVGSRNGVSILMSDQLPDLNMLEAGAQCFPLKLYEKTEDSSEADLFSGDGDETGYKVKDGITDEGLTHFRSAYPGEEITKEDLFYYVYGLLHSKGYRKRYADNLSKELPRIPAVKKTEDFWAFVEAGRKLGDLHVNYENVDPYKVNFKEGSLLFGAASPDDFRVTKMKFGKKGKETDKSVVIYNSKITMTDIPLEAYDYIVNGKAALEWVMDRQAVKTDKASGIVNDANDYAVETVGDPAYPLKLFQRVITVSLETMKIVNALPKFDPQMKEDT